MKMLHKEHLSWDRLAAQHQEEEGGREGGRESGREGGRGREKSPNKPAAPLQTGDMPAQYPARLCSHWPRGWLLPLAPTQSGIGFVGLILSEMEVSE